MAVASPFDRLAGIATLGTRRAPLPPDLDWPDASLTGVGTREQSVETRLLRIAAAHAMFAAAGARAAPEASSAAREDFPAVGSIVNDAAAWRILRMLCGEQGGLLSEWFALAGAAGRVVPPHLVPLVLGHVPPRERRGAGAVLGPVAAWLAALNPDWLVDAPAVELSDLRWKEGSLRVRLADLEIARRVDRVRSRAWLLTTWEQDPPEAREAFLEVLLPTVGPDDEEFLEMALDDKRKAVRQAACEGLSRLPESAHARRNLERLGELLQLNREKSGLLGFGRKRQLTIELPAAPDKAAQRDGIESRVPAAIKVGECAWWLMQMVARVPPRHWCVKFGCDAETFLDAALATDYQDELRSALTDATVRHPDREWSGLLVRYWLGRRQDAQLQLDALGRLVNGAPGPERAALLEVLIGAARGEHFSLVTTLLQSLEIHWNAALTNAAFDGLQDSLSGSGGDYTQPRNSLDQWARFCDVDTGVRRAAVLLEKCGEGHRWRNALEQFNDTVAFRAAMREELTK